MTLVYVAEKADPFHDRLCRLGVVRKELVRYFAGVDEAIAFISESVGVVLLLESTKAYLPLFEKIQTPNLQSRIFGTILVNHPPNPTPPIDEFHAIGKAEFCCTSAPNALLTRRINYVLSKTGGPLHRKSFPSLSLYSDSPPFNRNSPEDPRSPIVKSSNLQEILTIQKMKISTPRNPRFIMKEVGIALREVESLIATLYSPSASNTDVKAILDSSITTLQSSAPAMNSFSSQLEEFSDQKEERSEKSDSLFFTQEPSLIALISALQSRLIPFDVPLKLNYSDALERARDLAFDVFSCSHQDLMGICYQVFVELNFLETFRIQPEALHTFISAIQSSYRRNPYHNFEHAIDVFLNAYFFASCETVREFLQPVDILSLLVSALAHDIDHPGCNNAFEVNTSSSLALRYNDTSVLENHHASYLFTMLQDPKYNIVSGLSSEEFKEFRKIVVKSILSTDMAVHYDTLAKFVRRLDAADTFTVPASKEDRQIITNLILHFIDICNACKPWEIHIHWQDVLLQEFFLQGDRERALGLPLTNFCDRNNPNPIPLAINFMDHFITPLFSNISRFIPELNDVAGVQLASNREKWSEKQLAAQTAKRRESHTPDPNAQGRAHRRPF